MNILRKLIRTNLLKTIYFNFKMLPFKQAKQLPIFFYGKVKFRSLKGSVTINAKSEMGMIEVGIKDQYVDTSVPESIWTIDGALVFTGPLKIARGSYFLVSKSGTLTLGTNKSFYGSHLKIMCFDNINIGDCVRIAWECQIYDTSFHYVEKTKDPSNISPLQKPVFIGNRVWIGNRSTISKGSVVPDDTIVASNSLINKDFSDVEPFSLLAGMPAAKKTSGLKRIWDTSRQAELDKKYNYSRHIL